MPKGKLKKPDGEIERQKIADEQAKAQETLRQAAAAKEAEN